MPNGYKQHTAQLAKIAEVIMHACTQRPWCLPWDRGWQHAAISSPCSGFHD